jgi:hypothetical protein
MLHAWQTLLNGLREFLDNDFGALQRRLCSGTRMAIIT